MVPEGCATCPNRQQNNSKARGKWAAYLFALFLCSLLVAFSFEDKENAAGESRLRLKSEPPTGLLMIILPAVGICLGIQLSPESVGDAIGKIAGK